MKKILIFLLLTALVTTTLHAQNRSKNRFNAGLIWGVNTSQIDGDYYSGYDKFGMFGGLRAIARIGKTSELVFEMQYNRKGSKNPAQFVPGQQDRRFISLDYIEVPIFYHKKIDTKIGVGSIEGGIIYSRLFGFRINDLENSPNYDYDTFFDIQNDFNRNDLAVGIGGGIYINEHIRIMSRFTYAITLLYKNENRDGRFYLEKPDIYSLRNMQLGFGINYIF